MFLRHYAKIARRLDEMQDFEHNCAHVLFSDGCSMDAIKNKKNKLTKASSICVKYAKTTRRLNARKRACSRVQEI